MGISVSIDYREIEGLAERTKQLLFWEYVSSIVYGEVKILMNKGINVNGKRFQDYEPEYKAFKIEIGKYVGHVNLQLEQSNMFRNISFAADEKGFSIFINGDLNNTKAIRWNSHKNWQFFEWGTRLEKILFKAIDKALKDIGVA